MNPFSAIAKVIGVIKGKSFDGISKFINKRPKRATKALLTAISIFKKPALAFFKFKEGFSNRMALITRKITKKEFDSLEVERIKKYDKLDKVSDKIAKMRDNQEAIEFIDEVNDIYRTFKDKGILAGLAKSVKYMVPPPMPELLKPKSVPGSVTSDVPSVNITDDSIDSVTKITKSGVSEVVDLAKKIEDPALSNAMIALASNTSKGLQSVAAVSHMTATQLAKGTNDIARSLAGSIYAGIETNVANESIIIDNQNKSLGALGDLSKLSNDSLIKLSTVDPIVQEIPNMIFQNSSVTVNALEKVYKHISGQSFELADLQAEKVDVSNKSMAKVILGIAGNLIHNIEENIKTKIERINQNTENTKIGLLGYLGSVRDSVLSKAELVKEQYEYLKDSVKDIVGNFAFLGGYIYELLNNLPVIKSIKNLIYGLFEKFGWDPPGGGFEAKHHSDSEFTEVQSRANDTSASNSDRMVAHAELMSMRRENLRYELDTYKQAGKDGDEGAKKQAKVYEFKQDVWTEIYDRSLIMVFFIRTHSTRIGRNTDPNQLYIDVEAEGFIVHKIFTKWKSYLNNYRSTKSDIVLSRYCNSNYQDNDLTIRAVIDSVLRSPTMGDLMQSVVDKITTVDRISNTADESNKTYEVYKELLCKKGSTIDISLYQYFNDNGVSTDDIQAITSFVSESIARTYMNG